MTSSSSVVTQFPHHVKCEVSTSRARYRASRHEKAVKVYTISQESTYLLIQNVPALGISEDLQSLCDQYGIVEKFELLKDFPCEQFTEVYLVKYKWFPAARVAKRQLDEKAFFGTILHVCYAPERESLSETREKLGDRRKFVASKTKTGNNGKMNVHHRAVTHADRIVKTANSMRKIDTSNIQLSINNNWSDSQFNIDNSLASGSQPVEQPVTYIWAGKEYTAFPSQEKLNTNSAQPNNALNQDSSALASDMNIKKRLSKFNVPNSRVSFKRRKRI